MTARFDYSAPMCGTADQHLALLTKAWSAGYGSLVAAIASAQKLTIPQVQQRVKTPLNAFELKQLEEMLDRELEVSA